MKRKVISVAHHRNGITGAPFDVVLFKDDDGSTKVGISFDSPLQKPPLSCNIAILDVKQLAAGDVAFGSNSFRGDEYIGFMREATMPNHADRIPCIGTPAHSCGNDSTHVDQQGYTICADCAKERKKDGRESRRMTKADRETIIAGTKVAY